MVATARDRLPKALDQRRVCRSLDAWTTLGPRRVRFESLADRPYLAQITKRVISGVYQGVTTVELDNLAAETAAYMTTRHPVRPHPRVSLPYTRELMRPIATRTMPSWLLASPSPTCTRRRRRPSRWSSRISTATVRVLGADVCVITDPCPLQSTPRTGVPRA